MNSWGVREPAILNLHLRSWDSHIADLDARPPSAAEGRRAVADTHLALARCQNAGTTFWEFYINFKRINISAYFFCSFLRPKYDKIGYTDNPKVGFLSEI